MPVTGSTPHQSTQLTHCSTETLKNPSASSPDEDKGFEGSTPVLRQVGDKTPPGTLLRSRQPGAGSTSAKEWCQQYSQAFLSNVIDTSAPLPVEEDKISEDQENNDDTAQ